MTLDVNWYDDDNSIVVVTITQTTTWDEYHQAVDWIIKEATKSEKRVDIIFHDNVGMPKGNPFPHIKTGTTKIIKQSNIHLTIIAGSQGYSGISRRFLEILAKSFVNMMVNTPEITQQRRNQLLFMPTLEDSIKYIMKDRVGSFE